jgi:archaellum biogenesis ATPase FlaH
VRYAITYANSISLFLRSGRKTIIENAKTIVSSIHGEIKSIADLNRVEHVSEAVDNLSLKEIIDLRERGIDIVKYAKQKMTPQTKGRELQINSSILSTMRKQGYDN